LIELINPAITVKPIDLPELPNPVALGVTLISRNSRHFQLTSAGQTYYQNCCQIIQQIEFANTGRDWPLQQCRQLMVNEFILAKQFSCQGFGLVHLPLFMCCDELQSGELSTLTLAECVETKTLSLAFQKNKYMRGYIRRFIDYLVGTCRDRELWLVDHNQYLYQAPHFKR
jgi:DNA-binding transcriptional LysR family regulator